MEQRDELEPGLEISPAERERLVRLCAHLSGRADLAEDLTQDTLVEAWQQRHKLEEPAGQGRWLTAVARNVCLRWRRQVGREQRHLVLISADCDRDELSDPADHRDETDLEIELERQELAALLDRALALLPPVTRQALVHRYVEDLSQVEVAERLGLSEGAVAVRVHRGKLALRRALLGNLSAASGAYMPDAISGSWETTRLWCTGCGKQRLQGRMSGDPPVMTLWCPGCDGPSKYRTECLVPGSLPSLGYGRAISRVRTQVDRHYGLNRIDEEPRCSGCGRPTPLRVGAPEGLPSEMRHPGVHVFLRCDACQTVSHSSLEGITLSLPESQRFLRRHPRVRAQSHQEIEVDGLPAYVSRFESLDDGARLDVIVRREGFRLIAVHGVPGA
jgi:RNA polymerase sigma factor (sigma-70 family)